LLGMARWAPGRARPWLGGVWSVEGLPCAGSQPAPSALAPDFPMKFPERTLARSRGRTRTSSVSGTRPALGPRGSFRMHLDETSRISLDGYRIQTVERLKACRGAEMARDVLAEVAAVLGGTGLSVRGQRAFWYALRTEVEVIADEPRRDSGGEAEALSVQAAVRSEIMRYLQLAS